MKNNNNIIINNIKKNNRANNENKSNPKTYYSIYKQKAIKESSNIIKNRKKTKNCYRKNSNNLAFNPFNNTVQKNNNCEKSSINYSNSNNNISLVNSVKITNEKKLVRLKTSSNKSLNFNYENDQKKNDQSLSNKNIMKYKGEDINYYNNILINNNYNTINNANNGSYCSDNHVIKLKNNKKSKSKYNKNTYDFNSNDFAVCNTNSSLEEINQKLNGLSKNKNFSLVSMDLKNYICTKNKNNSIKIEISSKGNINMLKIYYLEGKESITKELIKNIIFSIGF